MLLADTPCVHVSKHEVNPAREECYFTVQLHDGYDTHELQLTWYYGGFEQHGMMIAQVLSEPWNRNLVQDFYHEVKSELTARLWAAGNN